MKKKIKRPPIGKGNIVKAHETPELSPDDQPPIFSLEHLTKDYCISSCTDEEKVSFVDHLHRLSQLAWKELRQAPRHGLGYEKINRDSIKSAIPKHITDDVKHFIAFRFYKKAPMVGHREERTFYIFWIDREFTLYEHN